MSRVKRGVVTKKRHKRLLKKTKGYWGQRKMFLCAHTETLKRAMAFAFKGRKLKKRDMRGLFIARIKAATMPKALSYNQIYFGLKQANVEFNQKNVEPTCYLRATSICSTCCYFSKIN